MSTALRPPAKLPQIRDTQGASRFAELRLIARLNAEAAAIIYRATGTVSKDVAPRLRQWVYGVQAGRIELGRDFKPMLEVIAGGVGKNVSHNEARAALAALLVIARQLIDLKLPPETPPDPDPMQGDKRAVRRGDVSPRWVGRLPLGSDHGPAPRGRAA